MDTIKPCSPHSRHHSPCRNIIKYLLTLLLPQTCLLCQKACHKEIPGLHVQPSLQQIPLICTHCYDLLPHLTQSCPRCALPMPVSSVTCGQCLRQQPTFDAALAGFLYEPPLSQLIHHFKQHKHLLTGQLLSMLLLEKITRYYQQPHCDMVIPDIIAPAPLHWRRQWIRGFNQSTLLARPIAAALGRPLFSGLVYTQAPADQKRLSRTKRWQNRRQHLAVTPHHHHGKHPQLKGKSVAIIDDVVTSGATANDIAYHLKKAGAIEVHIWSVARTPLAPL